MSSADTFNEAIEEVNSYCRCMTGAGYPYELQYLALRVTEAADMLSALFYEIACLTDDFGTYI